MQLHSHRDLELVPRPALVAHQHLDVVSRAGLRFVEIDADVAGHAAVARGRHRVGGIGVGRERGRNRTHAVGDARQDPDARDLDQVRIHALGRCTIGLEQLFRALVIEPGAGAQVVQELPVGPLEADLSEHGLHLAVDALHLLQAELVDLGRAHVGGREVVHQIGVVGLAVRQAGDADVFAGAGQVFVLEELLETLVGRVHHIGDGFLRRGTQSGLLGRRYGRWHLLERRIESAFPGFFDGAADFPWHALHDYTGLCDACLDVCLQSLGECVHVGAEGLQALEPVAVVGERLEAQLFDAARHELRSPQLGDHSLVAVPHLRTGQVVLQLKLEEAVVEFVFGVEAGWVDFPECRQIVLHFADFFVMSGAAGIAPAVVIAMVAVERGFHGVVPHFLLPGVRHQRL